MKIKYFADTDTALVEFSNRKPSETRELNENIYLDLDEQGRIVSLTIEHANEITDINDFSFQRFAALEPV